MIRIPSCPNSHDDYTKIWILTSTLYCRLWIWSLFDLISIKCDQNSLNSISFPSKTWLKDWKLIRKSKSIKRSKKMTLISIKRSKKWNLIEKSIYIDFFDQIWSLLIYFKSLSISFENFDCIQIWLNRFWKDDLIRFQEFGSKMLIKRRF